MKEFLRRLKLIDNLTLEMEVSKNEFVDKLRQNVDEAEIGLFSNPFEVFTKSKNLYKGRVGYDGFEIKRRRRFFDSNMNVAVARGSFMQKGNLLLIRTEINGFSWIIAPLFIVLIIFYAFFIGMFFTDSFGSKSQPLYILPFIIVHASLMFGLPYFIMKSGVKRLKRELERELFFIAKG